MFCRSDFEVQDAAERETLEEVGLNISEGNYAYLGRLDDRAATDTLTVSSFGM